MQTKDSIGPRPTNPENIFSGRGKLNFLPAGTVTQFWVLCTWMRHLCPSHRKTAGQSHKVIGHAAGTRTLGTSPFSLLPAMNPQNMQQERDPRDLSILSPPCHEPAGHGSGTRTRGTSAFSVPCRHVFT